MKNKFLFAGLMTVALLSAPVVFADHHGGGKKGGKMFEKHDTNGDGVISKSEFLAHAEERFAKMDKDGNDEVTKEEAEAHRKEMKDKWKERKNKGE